MLWDDSEEFRRSAGVLRDMTERIAYKQRLKTQNERSEEFTGIVSHELRSPLKLAESHFELALIQDSYESEHLVEAQNAIKQSQALIEDLLTLARGGN